MALSVKPLDMQPFISSHSFPVISYQRNQHLVDVTEMFNLLHWEKKQRLFKLAYLIFLLFLSLFWYIVNTLSFCYEHGFLRILKLLTQAFSTWFYVSVRMFYSALEDEE